MQSGATCPADTSDIFTRNDIKGIPKNGLPINQGSETIRGLTKDTTYSCFVVAYNTAGQVCSDAASGLSKTKSTITEYGTPEGIALYKTNKNQYVAWITDYNTKVTPNPSRLTYCTVDSTSWQFLGCSYVYNSDLKGPSGIVLYQPPSGSLQTKPLLISIQVTIGNSLSCVLDETYGINDACGLNNLNFPGARDIALYTAGGKTYAYTTDKYGGSGTAEIVKYEIDSFGDNGGRVQTQTNVSPADIWGIYVAQNQNRLYYVASTNQKAFVCDLDTNSGSVLAACQEAYPAPPATPLLGFAKDILLDDNTPQHAYISDQNGIILCNVNSGDGKLSTCQSTGTGFDYPYGMYIVPGASNTPNTGNKMYVVSTRGSPGEAGGSVSICDRDINTGVLSSCQVM